MTSLRSSHTGHTVSHARIKSRYHSNVVDNIKHKTQGAITARITKPVLLQYATALRCTARCFLESSGTSHSVDDAFERQVHDVQTAAKRALQRRYSWAFRRHSKLPTAYALPKGKKDFQSGRPIVSFVEAFMRPLLEATARPLYGLCTMLSLGLLPRLTCTSCGPEYASSFKKTPMKRNQLFFLTSISAAQFQQAWKITREVDTAWTWTLCSLFTDDPPGTSQSSVVAWIRSSIGTSPPVSTASTWTSGFFST